MDLLGFAPDSLTHSNRKNGHRMQNKSRIREPKGRGKEPKGRGNHGGADLRMRDCPTSKLCALDLRRYPCGVLCS